MVSSWWSPIITKQMQRSEPSAHSRAIIAELCTCHWSQLVPQAQDTLNMLQKSITHLKFSAYHMLEGVHDYNKVLFAPPRTLATVFNPPEIQNSWEIRALDAWYVGPAYNHYICWKFFIKSTGGYRISGHANFYPQHCQGRIKKQWDEIKRTAATLAAAIMKLSKEQEMKPKQHIEALQKLSDIFKVNLKEVEREYALRFFSSSTPTSKEVI